MGKTYLYPQNLKAKATLWFWRLRDFLILGAAALVSSALWVETGILLPAALTLGFGFFTVQMEDTTILDYLGYALGYFLLSQQRYEWR